MDATRKMAFACAIIGTLALACNAPATSATGPTDDRPDAGAASGPAIDAGTKEPDLCKGYQVLRMSGRVLDINGNVPGLRVFTLCGNACLRGDLADDGTFVFENDFCFRSVPPLTRPVFIYHGGDGYTDLYFDFVPKTPPTVVRSHVFERTFYTVPVSEMATVQHDATAAQTLRDGNGFELSFEPGAALPPIGAETFGVKQLMPEHYPAIEGMDTVVALYAFAPASTTFDPPARVQFPNHDGLAPGTVVEIVAVGDFATEDVFAGTLGRVAMGSDSGDGARIELDAGEGIRVLTPLGYRRAN